MAEGEDSNHRSRVTAEARAARYRNKAQARQQRGRRRWLLVGTALRSSPAHRHTCLASASSAQRTKIGLWVLTANSPKWRNHSMAEQVKPAAAPQCEVGHTAEEEILTADGFIGRRPIAYRPGQTT
jgi:hypothetical protein